MVKKFESLKDFNDTIESGKIVVIDFTATWCGPCRIIGPIFEKLESNYPGVEFYKVDVDDQADIAQEVSIRVMPTFMLFGGKKKVGEFSGAIPQKLQELLEQGKTLVAQVSE